MFFMHGGGYVGGSSMWEEPENLLDHGVLLVTINYRLGPFGFISTQDEVIPGNNGLKDQQSAIQWTHDNIHLFGGDPNKITILGQSAGSSSVTYQLLNRGIEGLIVGGICESGTYLSAWSYQRRAREIAFATAALMNDTFLTNNNSQDLLEYLQSVPAKDLDEASDRYHDRVSFFTTSKQNYRDICCRKLRKILNCLKGSTGLRWSKWKIKMRSWPEKCTVCSRLAIL
jgi:carboxylesterase type B